MSTIVIVGGHGKIGLLLAARLAQLGHSVRSTIRNEAHSAEVEGTGAVPVLLDLEAATVDDYARVFDRADAVVFSAGAGGSGGAERKLTVDLGASVKSIAAAQQAGIRRFVQVSAISVDEPLPADTDAVWRAYVDAKRDADAALRDSDLDFTIVRPGTLTDDDGTGLVRIGARVDRASVPRADVAAVIAAVLDDDASIGAQFELTSGEKTIADALQALGTTATG